MRSLEVTRAGRKEKTVLPDYTTVSILPWSQEILNLTRNVSQDLIEKGAEPEEHAGLNVLTMKKTSAQWGLACWRIKTCLQWTNPSHIREVAANNLPSWLSGTDKWSSMYDWLERYSGLYVSTDEETQKEQLRIVQLFLSNLTWRVKTNIRKQEQTSGPPDPTMDPEKLMADTGVDIRYVRTWAKSFSYFKKNINQTDAIRFASELLPEGEINPYVAMGKCPACEVTVVPGNLKNHLKEGTCKKYTDHKRGMDLTCTCGCKFRTLMAYSQHRTLHCRATQAKCPVCGALYPCNCVNRRVEILMTLGDFITSDTRDDKESAFNLREEHSGKMLDATEMLRILKLADTLTPPSRMVETYNMMKEIGMYAKSNVEGDEEIAVAGSRTSSPGIESTDNEESEDEDSDNESNVTVKNPGEYKAIGELGGYACTLCLMTFTTEDLKETHIRTRHFQCTVDECRATFTTVEDMLDHANTHQEQREETKTKQSHKTKDAPFQCPVCPRLFTTTEELIRHMEREHASRKSTTKHPQTKDNPLNCPIRNCDEILMGNASLEQHLQDKHKMSQAEKKTKTYRSEDIELFRCPTCKEVYYSSIELWTHNNEHHSNSERSLPKERQKCPACDKVIEHPNWVEHIKKHTDLFQWNLKGVACGKCASPPMGSVAGMLIHYYEAHRPDFQTTMKTLEIEIDRLHGGNVRRNDAIIMALKKIHGEETHSCNYEDCNRIFMDQESLKIHSRSHCCMVCQFAGARSDAELEVHLQQHTTTKGTFSCEKCSLTCSTIEELARHKETHKKFPCNKCNVKFHSEMAKMRHEMSCTSISEDLYTTSSSSDPLLITMQCMSSLLKSGHLPMDAPVKNLLEDQIDKARASLVQTSTMRKVHNRQRTYTFLKIPRFGPGNTSSSLTAKDTSILTNKEFAGNRTAEENYTILANLLEGISLLIDNRNLTEDAATRLLCRFLKPPAKDFAGSMVEEFESQHGSAQYPAFEDVVLFLESNFVNIKPAHAKEQLLAMKKTANESESQFFIRLWRVSHFASFTTTETGRLSFRNDTVKEVLMRNLTATNREVVDEEELQRAIRNEPRFKPRELVEFLNNRRSHKEAFNPDRRRTDFSTVGLLHPTAQIDRVTLNTKQPFRGRWKRRGPPSREWKGSDHANKTTNREKIRYAQNQVNTRLAQNTRPRAKTIYQVDRRSAKPPAVNTRGFGDRNNPRRPSGRGYKNVGRRNEKAADPKWLEKARESMGTNCFKCGKQGHSHKE